VRGDTASVPSAQAPPAAEARQSTRDYLRRIRLTASLTVGTSGIAATALIEGFVFGIVAYLRVLLEAVAAIAIALLIAVYVKRGLGAPETPDETTSTRTRRFG
jgi:hypothetical protein